jgi:hypothetical protein
MAQETLKITITADNKDAVNNIQQTITATNNLGNAFKQLPNTSNQATNALTNLSRVAQDAPYGFIGIANNLNPLLESFQRLQKESGSTSSALKAMAQGLMGPAGVGLALGAVSSIIVAFGPKIASFINGTTEASKAEDKFAESLDKAKASASETGIKLQAYLGIADNVTIAEDKRANALKFVVSELAKVNSAYAQTITTTDQARAAVDLYTQALIAQAITSRYVDEIANKQIELTNTTEKALKAAQEYNNTLEVSKNMTNGYVDASIVQNGIIQKSKDRYVEAANAAVELQSQIGGLNDKLQQTVTAAATNPFNTITNGAKQLKDVTGKIVADLSKISYAGLPQMNGANVPQGVNPIQPTQAPQTLPEGGIQPAQSIVDAQAVMDQTRQFELLNQTMQLTGELTNIAGGAFNSLFESFINGQDFGDALAEVFKNILIQLVELVAQTLIFKAILGALGLGTPALAGLDLGAAAFGQGGGLTGEFLLKGSNLVLSTTRSQQNLNLRRGK